MEIFGTPEAIRTGQEAQIDTNQSYWQKKLARNVERDREVNDQLTEQGWLVLRFWESDIKKDLDSVLAEILSYI